MRTSHPQRRLVSRFHLHLILLAGCLLSACQPSAPPAASSPSAWRYADLRLVDPPDDLPPSSDLLAVYLRTTASLFDPGRLLVRLELLELSATATPDIWLALDHAPGGRRSLPDGAPTELEWDTLLLLPANGLPHLLDEQLRPRPDASLQVLRDPLDSCLDISMALAALPRLSPGLRVQAFTRLPAEAGSPAQPGDSTPPAALHGSPPPPVPLLLVFWNVFPAYTPAQALRRWDGAHTGPLGGRHGLYNLLRLARNHQTPLWLLDLSAPESLAALDFAGGLPLVSRLARDGLLVMPEYAPEPEPGCPVPPSETSAAYDLPAPSARYAPPANDFASTAFLQVLFAGPSDELPAALTAYLVRSSTGRRLLLPPALADDQAPAQLEPRGLSLAARRLLATAAASPQPPLMALGGSLPSSPWGAPELAQAGLRDLRSRPWIRLLDAAGVAALPTGQPPALAEAPHQPERQRSVSPISAASSTLEQAYRQACRALQAPLEPSPPELLPLRQVYRRQVELLHTAAAWELNPAARLDCAADLDGDGLPECWLSSEQVLAVFQPEDAVLSYLFIRQAGQVHQVIGPSSQFVVGQSDPSGWRLEPSAGLHADPAVLTGAFALAGPCLARPSADLLEFDCPSSRSQYRLLPAGLEIRVQADSRLGELRLPLALDPWQRWQPGWVASYSFQPLADGQLASLADGAALIVTARLASGEAAPAQLSAFLDALPDMGRREDPNREPPLGFYLPFPLALLSVQPSAAPAVSISLEITGSSPASGLK